MYHPATRLPGTRGGSMQRITISLDDGLALALDDLLR
jgi:hypothetical protein